MNHIKPRNKKGAISMPVVVSIVIALIVGAGVFYAISSSNNRQDDSSEAKQATKNNHRATIKNQNKMDSHSLLQNAIEGKGAVKCTFKDAESTGTTYINSGKRFRADFESSEGAGHIIVVNNEIYSWQDGQTQGIKTAYDADSENSSDGYKDYDPEYLSENYDKENIDCQKTKFDTNLLQLPAGVEFVSLEQMMPSDLN